MSSEWTPYGEADPARPRWMNEGLDDLGPATLSITATMTGCACIACWRIATGHPGQVLAQPSRCTTSLSGLRVSGPYGSKGHPIGIIAHVS